MHGPSLFRLLVPAMCTGWLTGGGHGMDPDVALFVAAVCVAGGTWVLLACTLDRHCRGGVMLFGLGLGMLAAPFSPHASSRSSLHAPLLGSQVDCFEITGDMGRSGNHHRAAAKDGRGRKVLVEWHETLTPGTVCLAGFRERMASPPFHVADFDEGEFLRGRGIRAICRLDWCAPSVPSHSAIGRLRHMAHGMRNRIITRIKAVDHGAAGGLLIALTTGDKQGLPSSLKRSFSQAGLAHLMAVSGFHTGLVVAGVLFLLRLLGCPPQRRGLAVVPAVWAYVAIVGFPGSAMRAASMVMLWAAAEGVHRKADGLSLLAAAGALLWCGQVNAPLDLGVGLSFTATCGILLLHRWLRIQHFSRRQNKVLMAIGVPLVATACTAPLAWPVFGQVPVVFLPANLLATPVVMGLVLMTFLWLAFPPLGEIGLSEATVWLAEGFIRGVEHANHWPPLLLPMSEVAVTAAGLAVASGVMIGLLSASGAWRYGLAGVLTAWAVVRLQQHHEQGGSVWAAGAARICLDAGIVSVFPAPTDEGNGAPLKWKTRTLLERVSRDPPDTLHGCGGAMSFSTYRLRTRTQDGAWTEPVNSSPSRSGSHVQRRFPTPPSP